MLTQYNAAVNFSLAVKIPKHQPNFIMKPPLNFFSFVVHNSFQNEEQFWSVRSRQCNDWSWPWITRNFISLYFKTSSKNNDEITQRHRFFKIRSSGNKSKFNIIFVFFQDMLALLLEVQVYTIQTQTEAGFMVLNILTQINIQVLQEGQREAFHLLRWRPLPRLMTSRMLSNSTLINYLPSMLSMDWSFIKMF